MKNRKSIVALAVLVCFAIVALASASSSPSSRSSVYDTGSCVTTPSKSYIEKTDFPDEPCRSCKGSKGYYLFDNWVACKRCGGTGKEPKH